jgi:hypothetical protein
LVVGGSGSAWYFSRDQAQQERLLAVALSTQRRLGQVEDSCSQRCNCQFPDLGELRSALYSPLGPVAPSGTAGGLAAAPAANSSARPEPTVEQVALAARAQDLLAAATRTQRWTEADHAQLQALLRDLPPEEHQQLSFSLGQLINDGKIHVDDDVFPF